MRPAPTVSAPGQLERAKNATVFIKTPWGSGSGFFIAKNYIITNKHVVEFNQQQLAELKEKTDKIRQLVDLEKQKIARWKARMSELPRGPERSQLAIVIEEHETELRRILPQLEEREKQLEQLEGTTQASDIKIFLADGSEFQPNYILTSERHDLAILTLFSREVESIPRLPATEGYLQAGTKVYTIGSPFGLQQTMTSGVISAYRKNLQNEQVYLQTDAAINPGNSGGPLVDERGYALGVNTMIMRDSEGLGFAIPIDVVFEEFSSTLR
jgi:S1-C subfamily serine protease